MCKCVSESKTKMHAQVERITGSHFEELPYACTYLPDSRILCSRPSQIHDDQFAVILSSHFCAVHKFSKFGIDIVGCHGVRFNRPTQFFWKKWRR